VQSIEVSPEVRQGRNKLAATVVAGHAVKHLYNSALQVILLPVIKDDLALTGAQFGALSTAGRITGGVTTMWAGYLGDRFANRSGLMLAISLGLMGGSYFLLGRAISYWYLFAVMLLVGIGPSLFHPPAIASLSRKFPDKRGLAISLHGAGGSVGEVIGPVLTGALLTGSLLTLTYLVAFTWREVLQISIVPAFASAVVIFLMMRNIPSINSNTGSARDYFSSLFALLRKRAMLILVAVTALRSMGQSAVIAFLPVYLLEDLSFSLGEIALYMAGAQLVGIAAQPVMGYLSDRFGRKVVLIPTLTALGLLYVALKFAEPGPQLLITVLAMGAFLYSLHVIFIAAAMDVSEGEAQSTVVSLIYGASFIGVLSPFLAGLIVDASVTSNAFIFAAVVSLASVVIFAFVRLPKTVNQEAGSSRH